ncbi:SatD family protein [Nocardioides sp. CPCC 205120]|uniref:SatD family protein n=1 Tax=Nocardioides sp. CPCC 205120 TaxID=3406462 RepID=UPI003B501913
MIVYAVIGDIVGSRRAASRSAVQAALAPALARVDAVVPSLDGLLPTVGDEFQGAYATLEDAVSVTLLARLHLLPLVDTRYGVGVGEREVLDVTRTPPLQDGPAWWTARAAIDELGRPSARARRGWYDATHAPGGPAGAGVVNAYLLCRDALVDRLGERGQRILRASLGGASQREIATAEGISEPAVSQHLRRGVGAVRDAHAELRRFASATGGGAGGAAGATSADAAGGRPTPM